MKLDNKTLEQYFTDIAIHHETEADNKKIWVMSGISTITKEKHHIGVLRRENEPVLTSINLLLQCFKHTGEQLQKELNNA